MYRDGIHSDYEQPITIDGSTAPWSAFYAGTYNAAYLFKNYFMEDASFVRLRNVSVGLDFAKVFKMQRLSRVQLVLSGRNLWTLTSYSGMDPEISTYGGNGNPFLRGLDEGSQPNLKTYQITLNIGL